MLKISKETINERKQTLEKVKATLKEQFIGIDKVIVFEKYCGCFPR